MGNLSFIEGIQLLSSLGVFSGGIGLAGWVLRMERRVQKLEIMDEIHAARLLHNGGKR